MKKKKIKTTGQIEQELFEKSFQNKRYHMKVKQSGSVYNRQKNKKIKDYEKGYNHEDQ